MKRLAWRDVPLPRALQNERSLKRLLAAEKERRGVATSQLIFIGTHNVAQFWWCGMYAVRKSRQKETEFFASYIEDRLRYALALSRIDRMPIRHSAILSAGIDLTLKDVEALFVPTRTGTKKDVAKTTKERKRVRLVLESMDDEDYQWMYGETYPAFRWNFPWRKYTVVGIPDGLTQRFVYEFKMTRNRHSFNTVARPVATTQADLYGMFFGRKTKRVQVYLRDEGITETITDRVDLERAELTLGRFSRVDRGILPRSPMAYKCKRCEERVGCPIRQD